MFYLLLIGLCLSAQNSYTMSKADEWLTILNAHETEQAAKASHVAQLVEAINKCKKEKHEKVARLVFHAPFPLKATRAEFEEIKKIFKPAYVFVLAQMLQDKVINPNMYYEFEEYSKIPNIINVLFETMQCAMTSKLESQDTRLEAVKTVIEAGANLNQKGVSSKKIGAYRICPDELPLYFAKYDPALVALLIEKKAKVTPQLLLDMVFTYNGISNDFEKKLYPSIELVLKTGIDVNEKCEWGYYRVSSLEYAKEHKITKLVQLFETYVNESSKK